MYALIMNFGGRGQFPLGFVGDELFNNSCTQLSYISQATTQHTSSVYMHSEANPFCGTLATLFIRYKCVSTLGCFLFYHIRHNSKPFDTASLAWVSVVGGGRYR